MGALRHSVFVATKCQERSRPHEFLQPNAQRIVHGPGTLFEQAAKRSLGNQWVYGKHYYRAVFGLVRRALLREGSFHGCDSTRKREPKRRRNTAKKHLIWCEWN